MYFVLLYFCNFCSLLGGVIAHCQVNTVELLFKEVLDETNDILRHGQIHSKMHGIEPRYNEPRYNEFFDITNIIRKPKRKIYLDITNYKVNTRRKIKANRVNS